MMCAWWKFSVWGLVSLSKWQIKTLMWNLCFNKINGAHREDLRKQLLMLCSAVVINKADQFPPEHPDRQDKAALQHLAAWNMLEPGSSPALGRADVHARIACRMQLLMHGAAQPGAWAASAALPQPTADVLGTACCNLDCFQAMLLMASLY